MTRRIGCSSHVRDGHGVVSWTVRPGRKLPDPSHVANHLPHKAMIKPSLQNEMKRREVDPDRLKCSSARPARMLGRIGVDGQPMHLHIGGIGIFPREHLAVEGPAGRGCA